MTPRDTHAKAQPGSRASSASSASSRRASLWAMALLALSSGFALVSAILLSTGYMPVW